MVGVYHGGASVLDLVPSKADPILRLFQGTGSTDLPVTSVRVKVSNGSAAENQAANATLALGAVGFLTDAPDTAPANTPTTMVVYAPGHEAHAQLLARYIAGPVRFEVGVVSDVGLVTGSNFTGVRKTPKPLADVPISTTTTTTRPGSPHTTPTTTPSTTTTVLGIVPSNPRGVSCG